MNTNIRKVEIKHNATGEVEFVKVIFGPHFYVVVDARGASSTSFTLGATHHGITIHDMAVNGKLTEIIDELRNTNLLLNSDLIPEYRA